MKNFYSTRIKWALATFVAFCAVVSSCTEDRSLSEDVQSDITVKNGYLEFKDEQAFQRTRDLLRDRPQDYVDSWENKLGGFISQRALYNKAVTEEMKLLDSNESATQVHSSFVEQNKSLFLFDDYDVMELNLPETEEMISYFVNRHGLVKIGDKLYKHTKYSIKAILDGDEKKLSLLDDIYESSKEHGVMVYNITYRTVSLQDNESGRSEFSGQYNCTGYTSGGGQRVNGKVLVGCTAVVDIYGNLGYPGQVVTQTTVKATAQNQMKKGFLGWVSYQTYQLVIDGSVTVTAPLNSGTYPVYATSASSNASYIEQIIWQSQWYPQQCPVAVAVSGTIHFWGRHGSNCGG